MPIDASIYNNAKINPVQLPDVATAAETGMKLSTLGMQQAQMQRQMQQQQAMRQAYVNNTDDSGNINHQGVLSDLGKMGYGQMAGEVGQQFNAQDKSGADAKLAQMQAAHQTLSVTTPALQHLLSLPDDQAQKAFPNVIKQLGDQGVPLNNVPPEWDRGWATQAYSIGSKMKEGIENQQGQAGVQKTYADIGMVPLQKNAEAFGSRSPNAELTSQYDKQAAPIRASQLAMQQMYDNYNHPSPQGDASLILNAFKIKFPTAPDVNSLEELSKSQSAPDQWKQWAAHATAGGLDQGTRDNLMRDASSTFRANVDSLKGIQQRYQARAKQQNVNDPTLTAEPAIDKTSALVTDLANNIGPYVPPTERGGISGAISKFASNLMGGGGSAPANASEKAQPKYRPAGAKVSSDQVAQYATKHGMKMSDAQTYLRSQGYAVGN